MFEGASSMAEGSVYSRSEGFCDESLALSHLWGLLSFFWEDQTTQRGVLLLDVIAQLPQDLWKEPGGRDPRPYRAVRF
jgi:hypothetical protein